MELNKDIQTLAEFKDKYYGKIGTRSRDKLDRGFAIFNLTALNNTEKPEELAINKIKKSPLPGRFRGGSSKITKFALKQTN